MVDTVKSLGEVQEDTINLKLLDEYRGNVVVQEYKIHDGQLSSSKTMLLISNKTSQFKLQSIQDQILKHFSKGTLDHYWTVIRHVNFVVKLKDGHHIADFKAFGETIIGQ